MGSVGPKGWATPFGREGRWPPSPPADRKGVWVRSFCPNEDGRIQLRKESLLQEVIHSEKLNGAFRRAEAELP